LDVLLICPNQAGNRNEFIIDGYSESLPEHRFDDFQNRAFAQIVSSVFKTQPQKTKRAALVALQQSGYALYLFFVTDENRVEQWSRNVQAPGMIGKCTQ